jgi:hypothetical protein
VSHSIPILLWTFLIAYSKPKLKSNGDKASPFSDYSEQEIHQTNVYLFGPYDRFHFTGFLEAYK